MARTVVVKKFPEDTGPAELEDEKVAPEAITSEEEAFVDDDDAQTQGQAEGHEDTAAEPDPDLVGQADEDYIQAQWTIPPEGVSPLPADDNPIRTRLLDELKDALMRHMACEQAVDDAKAALKTAKEQLEQADTKVIVIGKCLTEIDTQSRPLLDYAERQAEPDNESIKRDYSPGEGWTERSEPVDLPMEDHHLSVTIDELGLEDIKGMGAKKVETLRELYPSIRSLEELRAKVGQEAATFAELLPKGFGKRIAEEIEEAILNYISRWSDQ